MGKKKDGGPPASWEIEVILIYCDLWIREIEHGNRPTTHFSKDGWRNLLKNFNEKTGRIYDRTQLKNKWDQLKKEWKLWKDLIRGETGIGWNPIKKTIDASDEWWQEKLQALPAAKKFRYNGIILELDERLDKMFGRIIATGNDVWVPNSGVMPPDLNEEPQVSSDVDASIDADPNLSPSNGVDFGYEGATQTSHRNGPSHSKFKKSRKSKLRCKEDIKQQIEDLVVAATSISDSLNSANASRRSCTVHEALDQVARIPEIFDDIAFYDFATDFMQDRNQRDIFICVPSDRKVWWLRRRFNRSTN